MPLESPSAQLSAGALLIAPGTPLPPGWLLENGSVAGGWRRLASTFDGGQVAGRLVTAGWTFFLMAGAITATALGSSWPKRLDAALARLIKIAALQKCNCLEIDCIEMRSFLGIPYASVVGHSRHILEGMLFSGQ
jgi:hypothetical protein